MIPSFYGSTRKKLSIAPPHCPISTLPNIRLKALRRLPYYDCLPLKYDKFNVT
jgi:hypothetical protein